MNADTPYEEITEAVATERGLQETAQYRRDPDGKHRAYHVETRTFWTLGQSPLGADGRDGRSAVMAATVEAHELLERAVEQLGGRVACAVTIVHVTGITPSGGVQVTANDDGPQNPQDMLEFVLQGASALAAEHGIAFATIDGAIAAARPQG